MGPAGVKGETGYTGVKGEAGIKGDMGFRGIPGLQGIGAVWRLIYVAVVLRYDVIVENPYCENQRFDRILRICEHSVMQNE